MPAGSIGAAALADALDLALPQTQCTRCGYDDCRRYAVAIADGGATTNRCPPGGAEGAQRLAQLAGVAASALDPGCGVEAPRQLAVIDENWCIGCALCLAACPVDAIVGAAKRMHTVVERHCTGCELCIPVCPVDCISLVDVTGERTGWNAWTPAQAARSRQRYEAHRARGAGAGAGPSAAFGTPATDDGPTALASDAHSGAHIHANADANADAHTDAHTGANTVMNADANTEANADMNAGARRRAAVASALALARARARRQP